ncbi:Replication factor C subunit 3 [Babesia sp. Xinjiang]|uniref:Replication factor C subunit 3 n=1 Tax=Babesia sp. Xinjiang TaxID=462227 RepID=UPI000A222768|nr:Replication factor C subunit 3 [Babesia sp. Xinjiang]ORM39655.1 Replication factor C subunit 3 [Babesia sp. Xinjiang]
MATTSHTQASNRSSVLKQLEEADSMSDEERVNKYFYNLYVANLTTDDIIDVMRQFEASPPESRNRKTYRTMLKILFNECRFFPKYPVQELAITAELFGKMIKSCLLLSNANLLMLALRCIIEALKRGRASKMFQFGTIALSQFENSIANYPWFSTALLELPDIRETFPQVYKTCEKLQAIMTDKIRGTLYIDQSKGIIIRPDDCDSSPSGQSRTTAESQASCVPSATTDKDRLDVGEMETLMNGVSDNLTLETPSLAIVNQIYAVFNNMSTDTVVQKAYEVNDIIQPENLSWLLLYIIKTRASKEQNLHEVFVMFIETLKIPKVFDVAIQITYLCITACLKPIVEHKELPSYRTLLKNLGSWLGRITLGRNIPIMSRHLDIKQVIFNAYENGAMIAALPFVCKALEHIQVSKIFKPPNPWTTAMLNFLGEIHGLRGLKTSLIFEIEVLFKHLDLNLMSFSNKTKLLESRVRPEDSPDFDTSTIEASPEREPVLGPEESRPSEGFTIAPPVQVPAMVSSAPHHLLRSTQPGMPHREVVKDTVKEKLNMLLSKVMREGPGAVRAPLVGAAAPTTTTATDARHSEIQSGYTAAYQEHPHSYMINGVPLQVSHPQHMAPGTVTMSNDAQMAPLGDYAEHLLQKLQSSIIISPSIALFEMQPHLRACVPIAIERAVRRVLPLVSEHAISISRATTRHLIANDFAGEVDETTLRGAILSMMEFLVTSLVVATCKEPLRIAFHESLRAALQAYSAQDCNNHVLVEQLVQIVCQDNLFQAVAVAEKIVGDQALREIEAMISDVVKLSKAQGPAPINLPPLLQQWNKLNVCVDKRNLTLYRSLFQNPNRVLSHAASMQQQGSPHQHIQHSRMGQHMSHPPMAQRSPRPQHQQQSSSSANPSNVSIPMAACNVVMSRFEECFAEVREPLRDIALFPPMLYSRTPIEPDYEPIMFSTHALLVLYSLPVDHELFSCISRCLNVLENSAHAEAASLTIAHRLLMFLCEGLGAQAGLNVEVLLAVLDGLNRLNPSVKQSLASVIFSQPLDRMNSVFNVVTVTGLLRYDLLDWSHLAHYLTVSMDKGRNSYALEMSIVVTAISVIDQRSVAPDIASGMVREIAAVKCGSEVCETYSGVLLKDARSKLLKDYMELHGETRPIISSLTPVMKRNLDSCITGGNFTVLCPSSVSDPLPEFSARDYKLVNLGFGGVRRVAPPPPVSDSHRAIVSIIFAKWIECSLPYEGENLLMAWRQFFQRFNLQSLFKMDGGTDNFFAICVGSALGTLSLPSVPITTEYLDSTSFSSDNIESLRALAKMSDVMLRLVGGSDVPPTSALQKLLAATSSLIVYEHNFVSYYKLWVVLLDYFDKVEKASGQVVCRITFLLSLRSINPTRAPEFCFFWLKLLGHKSLLPGAILIPRCWPHLATLFLEMTCFLHANSGLDNIGLFEGQYYDLVVSMCKDHPSFVVEHYFCFGGSARIERVASSCSLNPEIIPVGALSMPVDHIPAMVVSPTVSSLVVTLLVRHGLKSYIDAVLRTRTQTSRVSHVSSYRGDVDRLVRVIDDMILRDPGQCTTLMCCLSYYIGIEFPKSASDRDRLDEGRLYVYIELYRHLSMCGKHMLISSICRHLRYPNMHTHFFSCLIFWMYDELRSARDEVLRQIMLRVLLEHLLSPVECPWGVKLTVVELFRNPRYNLGGDSFKSIPSQTRSLIDAVAQSLEDLSSHGSVTDLLKKLVSKSHGELPHLLFYGPSGSGKKTRILATLRAVFGSSIDRVKTEVISNVDTSNEVIVCQSDHHIQIPCPELGNRDRVIVQDIIRNLSASPTASNYFMKGPTYRVFVFEAAESLSLAAQAALRRTMETYIKNARMILHVEQLSRVILPLRSRCLCIRVGSHSIAEIVDVLRMICNEEHITSKQASDDFLREIALSSGRNLRRAILTLETIAMSGFVSSPVNFLMPWERNVAKIVKSVMDNQSPSAISMLRPQVYELLVCCIPGEVVLETIVDHLSKRVNPDLIPSIVHVAAHFSHTMKQGSRDIWHIEACMVHIMSLLASSKG